MSGGKGLLEEYAKRNEFIGEQMTSDQKRRDGLDLFEIERERLRAALHRFNPYLDEKQLGLVLRDCIRRIREVEKEDIYIPIPTPTLWSRALVDVICDDGI